MSEVAVTKIEHVAESPVRLRECLTALAKHTGTEVLRFEIALGAPSVDEAKGGAAITMMVTHSLGPDYEARIAGHLARVLAKTFDAIANDRRDPPPSSNESTEKR